MLQSTDHQSEYYRKQTGDLLTTIITEFNVVNIDNIKANLITDLRNYSFNLFHV